MRELSLAPAARAVFRRLKAEHPGDAIVRVITPTAECYIAVPLEIYVPGHWFDQRLADGSTIRTGGKS